MATKNNPTFSFEDATRTACKASIMIEGLPGRGKTGLALMMGYILSDEDWSKVFHVDTENSSARLFVDIDASMGGKFGKFKVADFTEEIGFKPSNYLAYRQAAVNAGAKAVIFDSISHAWNYKGGVLDLVSQAKASNSRYAKDSYAAWGDETVVKEKNELLELIRTSKAHMITTVRVKEKMEYEVGPDGKNKLVSLGEQQIQQADLKYEPDLVLQMQKAGSNRNGVITHPIALCTKSRYAIFAEGETYEFTPELIKQLKAYLEEGVDPEELLQKQKDEYLNALKQYFTEKPAAKQIWDIMKKDAGFAEVQAKDIPLSDLKQLYVKITN